MQVRNALPIFLAVVCLGLGPGQNVHPFSVANADGFPFNVGEAQSTIVSPGTLQCPDGRLLISDDEHPASNGTVQWVSLSDPSFTPHASTLTAADPNMYHLGTNDHDLVQLGNGEVWYVTGAFTKRTVLKPPGKPGPAWFPAAYRGIFGPGARSVAMVWRSTDCGETFQEVQSLEFDPARISDRCAMPQRPRAFRHKPSADVPEMLAPLAPFAATGDTEWRYCSRCGQMVFEEGACPLGNKHSLDGKYKMLTSSTGAPELTGWKRCRRCGTLFHGNATKCTARTAHDSPRGKSYELITSTAVNRNLEAGWHWCAKCQTLFHGGNEGTGCPAGGTHDGDGNYQVALESFSREGDAGWRMCSKCRGLFLPTGDGGTGVCPLGGAHDGSGSKAYRQLTKTPAGFTTQSQWRMCVHCRTLFFFDPRNQAFCPFIRPHDGADSADYHMLVGSTEATNLQSKWRKCAKCGALYFSGAGQTQTACPAGDPGEAPVYDAGGSDGQLAFSDPANHRVYLTFQCVGMKPDALATKPFELSGHGVNETLIAVSSNDQPWRLIGTSTVRIWRMGIEPSTATDLAFGMYGTVLPAKFDGAKLTFGQPKQVAPALGWTLDTSKTPYDVVYANLWAHTLITRVPGTKTSSVLLAVPDTLDATNTKQGHGYRLFFYDPTTGVAKEAIDTPVVAASNLAADVAFHLQVIDPGGDGPILLTWNEFDAAAHHVTIRGRFITGDLTMTSDFTISRANGVERSFDVPSRYWFGDYQTSAGYAVQSTSGKWRYRPIWVEPGGLVRVGNVTYTRIPNALVVRSRAKITKPLAIDLSKLPPSFPEPH